MTAYPIRAHTKQDRHVPNNGAKPTRKNLPRQKRNGNAHTPKADYYARHKAEIAEYRKNHTDEIATYQKAYAKAHREERAAYNREYWQRNRDRLLYNRTKRPLNDRSEYMREYRKRNAEKSQSIKENIAKNAVATSQQFPPRCNRVYIPRRAVLCPTGSRLTPPPPFLSLTTGAL